MTSKATPYSRSQSNELPPKKSSNHMNDSMPKNEKIVGAISALA